MVDNTGFISTLGANPTAQIDDATDAIHSSIIMSLNAATGENRPIEGFNITQSTSSSHTSYVVTAGDILRNGLRVDVSGATLTTDSSTGTSNTVDWYGLIVVNSSNALAWRHGTSSPTTTGKLDTSNATVAALTAGDIPIAVVKYAADSAANVTSRPIQFLGYAQATRGFSAINSDAETMRINADGTLTKGSATITLPSTTGTLARTADNITGTAGGLSSTLAVDSGGTGQTSYTNGQLLIGNTTGNTLTKATLTADSNITITNDAGSISIAGTANDDVTKTNLTNVMATYTGDDTLTIGDAGDDTSVVIKGNLEVKGTTTTVNTQTINAQNAIVFEGATADDHETTLTITDPTADRTITLPDATGTVSLRTDAEIKALVGAMFTGNTETRITATYQSADNTIDLVADDMTAVRTVTAGGNTLGASETLAFTAGSKVTITESAGAVTIAASDTSVDINGLTAESAIVAGTDTIPFYDASVGANRKATPNQILTAIGHGGIPSLPPDKIDPSINSTTFSADAIPTLAQSKVTDLASDLASKVPTTRTVAGRALSNNLVVRVNASSGKLEFNDGSNTTTIQDTAGTPVDVVFDNRKTEYDEIQDANSTKPADNATVGARLGTNLKAADGSTTLGDADVKNASIASTHVVGSGKLFASTLPEDGATTGKLFFQAGVPTAKTVGDLWFDSDDSNRMYIAASATADQITSGEWESIGFPAGEAGATANSTEATQDIVGAMFASNTETLITATYQDGDGTIDLVVDNDLSNYDNSSSGFITATLTTEQVQDIVGAMFSSNTETRISATYEDSDGTIDLVADNMNFSVSDITGATELTSGLASTDELVLSDGGVLKRMDISVLSTYLNDASILTNLANTNTNQLTTFTLTGDSGSNQTIAHGNTLDIAGGDGIATVVGSTDTVTVGLDIDGLTDINAALVDADLMIVDDGAGGTNRKATMSRLKTYMQNNLTFTTNTNTVDMGDGFVVEDGDGTEVTITENKQLKFVEGLGININFTDTDSGADGDEFDLEFSIKDDSITEAKLDATNTPTDNYLLSYDSSSGGFTWVDAASAGSSNQTITTGSGIDGANSGSTSNITIALDIDGLADINAALADADIFAVDDGAGGTNRKATMSRLKTYMQNNLTFTTNTDTVDMGDGFTVTATTAGTNSTITEGDTLTIAAGTGITTTATSDGTITIASTVTDTNTQLSTEEVQDIVGAMFSSNTETRISATYEDGDGTIDLVVDDMTANTNYYLTGLALSSGTLTATVSGASNPTVDLSGLYTAGTGIDLSSTTLSVDVSDFMSNGSDNRIITATGTDAMNAEANLTFDGSTLAVTGHLDATTKSFVIPHPTKENMTLRHGSLEGPEYGVYHRGRLIEENVIELPEYWAGLVDDNTISVQLTPNGSFQMLYVEKIEDNKVYVINEADEGIDCFYIIHGERKDIGKMEVEY